MSTTKKYSKTELMAIIEALIFAADEPLSAAEIIKTIAAEMENPIRDLTFENQSALLPLEEREETKGQLSIEERASGSSSLDLRQAALRQDVYEAIEALKAAYNNKKRLMGRGFLWQEVAGGFTLRSDPQYAPFIRRLTRVRPQRLSKAALECLAIVAYQQPVTRPQIDAIRGVDSGGVLRALLERGLVRLMGRKEEPGRPLLYGTTNGFLSLFNLKGLSDLPAMSDLAELTQALPPAEQDLPHLDEPLINQVTPLNLPVAEDEKLLASVDGAIEGLKTANKKALAVLDDKETGTD